MRPQNKYSRQRPTNVPSFQFQPFPQRGVPVFYPQQATLMTDPGWYYNNMMLYQVMRERDFAILGLQSEVILMIAVLNTLSVYSEIRTSH